MSETRCNKMIIVEQGNFCGEKYTKGCDVSQLDKCLFAEDYTKCPHGE